MLLFHYFIDLFYLLILFILNIFIWITKNNKTNKSKERIKYLEQSLKYAILANSNLEIVIQQYLRVASIQLEIYDILEKNKDKISFDTSDLLTSNFSISDVKFSFLLLVI